MVKDIRFNIQIKAKIAKENIKKDIQEKICHNSITYNEIRSQIELQKKRNKKDIQEKICHQRQFYKIYQRMTPTNAEFNREFNDIRLKIQIEAKISEEKKQKRHFEEKICPNYKNFTI